MQIMISYIQIILLHLSPLALTVCFLITFTLVSLINQPVSLKSRFYKSSAVLWRHCLFSLCVHWERKNSKPSLGLFTLTDSPLVIQLRVWHRCSWGLPRNHISCFCVQHNLLLAGCSGSESPALSMPSVLLRVMFSAILYDSKVKENLPCVLSTLFKQP